MKYSEANEKLNLKNMLAEIKVQKVLRKPLGGGGRNTKLEDS